VELWSLITVCTLSWRVSMVGQHTAIINYAIMTCVHCQDVCAGSASTLRSLITLSWRVSRVGQHTAIIVFCLCPFVCLCLLWTLCVSFSLFGATFVVNRRIYIYIYINYTVMTCVHCHDVCAGSASTLQSLITLSWRVIINYTVMTCVHGWLARCDHELRCHDVCTLSWRVSRVG